MARHTFIRAIFAAVILSLTIAPGTALAAKPVEQYHDHFTDSYSDNVCGIDVDVEVVITDNFFVYEDGSIKATSSVKQTFTNPENGQSVVVSSAGQLTETEGLVNEDAGTITFISTYKGLPRKLQTEHGPVLFRDAGFISFAATFDLESGEFITYEITVNKGPHPEADSEGTLFCEEFIAALT